MSMSQYSGRCLTCVHWAGKKKATRGMLAPAAAMALDGGYAPSGGCEVVGDDLVETSVECGSYCQGGTASLETSAAFGCVLWVGDGPLAAVPDEADYEEWRRANPHGCRALW